MEFQLREYGAEDRAEKTPLKWGELSIENNDILNIDEAPSAEQQRDEEFAEAKEVLVVDAETGGIKQPAGEDPEAQTETKKFKLS